MEPYKLDPALDANKVFLVKRSELEGRLDVGYSFDKKNTSLVFRYPAKKLSKITRSLSGGTPNTKIEDYWNGDIIWVSPKDFKSFFIDSSIDRISKLGLENSSAKLIPERSLLMVVRSGVLLHTLPISINIKEVAVNQDVKAFIIDQNIIPEYLGYFFYTFNSQVLKKITKHSTTVQSVNTIELERLEIPIPPKEIQQQIVDIYNQAYTQKQAKEAEAKALLASIDTYLLGELGIILPEKDNSLEARIFTTNFSEVSGGRLDGFNYLPFFKIFLLNIANGYFYHCNLKEMISFLESGSRPTGGVSNIEDGVYSLGGEHVNNNCEIEIKNPKFIPQEYHDKIKNTEIKLLDILLVKDGATTGKVGIIEDQKFVNQNINEHVFIIRAKDIINPSYLAYLLYSSIGQIQISKGITGATVTGITKDVVNKIQIPLPPLDKQNEIAEHIAGIRAEAKRLQQEAEQVLIKAKQEVEHMILG